MAHTDLADLVAEAAQQAGSRTAVIDTDGRSMTWAQLEADVARLATGLGSAGVVAGRRVLLCLPNRLEFVVAWLAVLRAQAVAVPVNPRSAPADLAWMLVDSGARVALGDASTAPALREASSIVGEQDSGAGRPLLVLVQDAPLEGGERAYEDVRAVDPVPVPPLPDPEKPAALLYTSGTSGQPRAAVLSHRALLANLEQLQAAPTVTMSPDDVVLGALPLFHVYGLNAVLGSVLARQATLVLTSSVDSEEILELVERHCVTVLPIAPALVQRWLARDDLADRLRSVRLVMSGSAPLSSDVVQRFTVRSGRVLHQGYGLTEAAPVVASTQTGEHAPAGSVGTPLPGVDVRMVDADGAPAEPDDPGEIQIRGANLFSGYWPDRTDGPDQQGWWSTGDVGFVDVDGHLFLVDRVAELVQVAGFSVYPHEVEAVLTAVDGVRAAGVIGVPDSGTGQAVVAYVVAPDREPVALGEELQLRCAAMLAGFKRPVRVEIVDALPHSATGLVHRGSLRLWERRRDLGLLE